MCNICDLKRQTESGMANEPRSTSRRSLLGLAAAGMLAGLPAATLASGPPKPENKLSPRQALDRLMQGNARYVSGKSSVSGFSDTRERLSRGQNPYACILSCADSRVGPEFCFDEGRGDLFVTRVAGNFVTPDILASLEYGTAVLQSPLIMVLGHTSCGAIGAAVDAYTKHQQFPGHIQLLTTSLAGAVKAAMQDKPADNLIKAATEQNVRLNVMKLRQSTPLIAGRVNAGELMIVGGIYDLTTGKVGLVEV